MDRELLKPFKLCFGILRANGLWQDGKQSKLYIFYGCFVVLFFLILFTIGLLTYEIKTDDFDEKVVSFATALVYTGVFIKVVNFLLKFERIIEAFESLDNLLKDCKDPNQANRDCIRMKTRIAYNVLIMFWLSSILSWAAGFLSFIFAHRTPYNLWYPFDIQTSNIGFLIASFYVLLVSLSVGSFVIALDMLPVIFMSLAVGLINELSERLKAVDNKNEFIKCVVVHIKLKDFTRTIQELFASVILSQLVFTAVIMCTAVFALSKVSWNYSEQIQLMTVIKLENSSKLHTDEVLKKFSQFIFKLSTFLCMTPKSFT